MTIEIGPHLLLAALVLGLVLGWWRYSSRRIR